MRPGTFFAVGVGPGDPELLTLKAARIIAASPVVASFARRGAPGHARSAAAAHIRPGTEELRLEYPYTTEIPVAHPEYAPGMARFYEACAATLAAHLDAGRDVALLCEGDPFFYGSSMHLFDRLAGYASEVIPGVTGMSGCWTSARLPMTHGDDCLAVLPGTLDQASLTARLRGCDAAVVMKLGRNLAKVRAALTEAGLLARAVYVERGTMADERMVPLGELGDIAAPYFSMVLVPGRQTRAMTGWVRVVGLGPGAEAQRTPEAEAALDAASDLVGYGPYLARVAPRAGQARHASDNRVELKRACLALDLAAQGRQVAVVSAGDPGVFAMASAVFEAMEAGPADWRALDVAVIPGISAMFAAAARLGAPLGHDFCAISLSDNLKPWEMVTARLAAAATAGFVIAVYNPASAARPWQLAAAFAVLGSILAPETPVAFATAVGQAGERISITTLAEADAAQADMRTLVLIGAPATRRVARADGRTFLYTPRFLPTAS